MPTRATELSVAGQTIGGLAWLVVWAASSCTSVGCAGASSRSTSSVSDLPQQKRAPGPASSGLASAATSDPNVATTALPPSASSAVVDTAALRAFPALHCPGTPASSDKDTLREFAPFVPTPSKAAQWTLPETLLVKRALAAHHADDLGLATELWLQALDAAPRDPVITYLYARTLATNDPKGFDLIGELLVDHPGIFEQDVATDPAFREENGAPAAYGDLLRCGGALSIALEDERTWPGLDLNCDGIPERVTIVSRQTLELNYLALVRETPQGVRVTRLADNVYPYPTALRLVPVAPGWAAVLYENIGGHSADAELFVIREAPTGSWQVAHRMPFVIDGGESDDPPPADGRLVLTVIDLQGDATPELVLTLVDVFGAEPLSTRVLALTPKGVQPLGEAMSLRKSAARRLKGGAPAASRRVAEALLRLEPSSLAARLELLSVTPASEISEPNWLGFYAPGSNDDIALHSAVYARHAKPEQRKRLLQIPLVVNWLTRWQLTLEELTADSEPLLPLNLSSSARYLERRSDSMAFSYFYFGTPNPPRHVQR